jgi:hemerythrin
MVAQQLQAKLKLGVPEVDQEHELQAALLAALGDALVKGLGTEVQNLLQQLVDYTEVHFLSEELLMRFYSYPGYEEHVSEHAHLMDRVLDLKERWSDGDGSASRLLAELTAWVSGHIRSMDQALANYVREYGGAKN